MGKRPSSAPSYLEQKDLGMLLQDIALKSQTRKKNLSQTDLLINAYQNVEQIGDSDCSNQEESSYDTSGDRNTKANFYSRGIERRNTDLNPFKSFERYAPDETIQEKAAVDEESIHF